MRKSVEQLLFEAFVNGEGVRLSAKQVESLVTDDAVATRITNKACLDAGVEELGLDDIRNDEVSWKSFVKRQYNHAMEITE